MMRLCRVCFWIVLAQIVLSPLIYYAIISWPDSTDYFLQEVSSSVKGQDGRDYIVVGDPILIKAYNYRHLINGTCLLEVDRIRKNVGGKYDGKETVFQHVQQYFVGDGIIRRTSWPIPPVVVKVTDDWFDDPDATEQPMDIFTAGPYECNFLDKIRKWVGYPRMMHDAKLNPWREKTRVVLVRETPPGATRKTTETEGDRYAYEE